MAYQRACSADELWEGEMLEVEVGDHTVLLVRLDGGDVRAYQGNCPHQAFQLSEGTFEGGVLMCPAHQWTFDAASGQGVNPGNCRLAVYPVRIDGDDVMVEVDGVTPEFA